MKCFTYIDRKHIQIASDRKILPAAEFSQIKEAAEILQQAKEEEKIYREKVKEECETLKEEAKKEGFQEGLKQLAEKIILLEKEIVNVRKEMEKALVPLAKAAIKKIIGKELQTKPEVVSDIIATAVRTVSQHRRVTLYVNPSDLDIVEKKRPELRALFEHLESLTIAPKEDVEPGGCIIETEAGIINAQLENQLDALEAALRSFSETSYMSEK